MNLSNKKQGGLVLRAFMTVLLICLIGICGWSSCTKKLYQSQITSSITYPEPLPDTTPITFLPDVVPADSSNLNSAFSPDGKSFYFSRETNGKYKIYFTRYDGKSWSKAAVAPFSDNNYSNADPAFAPDGKLYFISNRPKKKVDISSDYDIWFVKSLFKGRWSKPKNLQIVNSDSDDYYVSFSKNGNLYFASSRKGGFGQEDIYVSKLVDGKYSVPENLGSIINSSKSEYDPCISPNEDFIVFTSSNRDDGFGAGDLYCDKLDNSKKWGTPVNLGKNFNTKAREYCSYISPDFKYLFFTSNGKIKWVSIRAITKTSY